MSDLDLGVPKEAHYMCREVVAERDKLKAALDDCHDTLVILRDSSMTNRNYMGAIVGSIRKAKEASDEHQ